LNLACLLNLAWLAVEPGLAVEPRLPVEPGLAVSSSFLPALILEENFYGYVARTFYQLNDFPFSQVQRQSKHSVKALKVRTTDR